MLAAPFSDRPDLPPKAAPSFPYDARVELALDAMSSAAGLNLPRFQALLGVMAALDPEDVDFR